MQDLSNETDILVVWNNIVQDKNTYSVGGTGNRIPIELIINKTFKNLILVNVI